MAISTDINMRLLVMRMDTLMDVVELVDMDYMVVGVDMVVIGVAMVDGAIK